MEAAVIGLISVVLGLATYIGMGHKRRGAALRVASASSAEAVADADAHIRAALTMVRTELNLVRTDLMTTHAELQNVRGDLRRALEVNERLSGEITRLMDLLDRR